MSRADSRDKRIDKIVGATIRRLRAQRGLTQMALGELLGVTFQQLQKYENGSNSVATARVPKLCNALHASRDELFRGTGIKRLRKSAQPDKAR